MTTIVVNDQMQQNYRYTLTAQVGQDFHPEFKPQLTPKEMLELGVFGGKYLTDCQEEFPTDWFENALCVLGISRSLIPASRSPQF